MKSRLVLFALVALGGCCFGQPGTAPVSGPITPLSTDFTPDPMLLSGTAGGPTDASALNANCNGHVALVANHSLSVTTPMPSLRIFAHADGDTTLVVRLADGRFVCNDDGEGTDPIVDLENVPVGQHNVYVGTYSPGAAMNYQLGITRNRAITPSFLSQQAAPPSVLPAPPTGTPMRTGSATVQLVSGNLPGVTVGSTCTYTQFAVDPSSGFDCRWQVVCAGVMVYGEGAGGFNPCNDPSWPPGTQVADLGTSSGDRDPSLVINTGRAVGSQAMVVRDDSNGARGEFQITATLDPIPPG
jgi:hypothetical protein